MLEAGIVQPSISPFFNPVVLVKCFNNNFVRSTLRTRFAGEALKRGLKRNNNEKVSSIALWYQSIKLNSAFSSAFMADSTSSAINSQPISLCLHLSSSSCYSQVSMQDINSFEEISRCFSKIDNIYLKSSSVSNQSDTQKHAFHYMSEWMVGNQAASFLSFLAKMHLLDCVEPRLLQIVKIAKANRSRLQLLPQIELIKRAKGQLDLVMEFRSLLFPFELIGLLEIALHHIEKPIIVLRRTPRILYQKSTRLSQTPAHLRTQLPHLRRQIATVVIGRDLDVWGEIDDRKIHGCVWHPITTRSKA
ncbi:hypothetical protein M5K25_006747 [Dendrobium thyrsiflorum]|uniref:Uncharacterized protein n=1 Tax=Dendrobium thyrsiflorum TaxID=117978 RepID=A0ABD0VCF0_DENTH